MTDHAGIADALTKMADALDRYPDLDPDRALRIAIWNNPNASYPGHHAPAADLYDETVSAILTAAGMRGASIDNVPRPAAILAARTEAARFQSYGSSR
ncbi:hypothetical protein [Streptomyces sp. YIM S03343]